MNHPASEAQLRLRAAVRAAVPDARAHQAALMERPATGPVRRSLGEALALLRGVRAILTRARPLRPEDLRAPQSATGLIGHVEFTAATMALVEAQRNDLVSLGDALGAALNRWTDLPLDPRAAIGAFEQHLRLASSFGIDRAFPSAEGTPAQRFESLRAQAGAFEPKWRVACWPRG